MTEEPKVKRVRPAARPREGEPIETVAPEPPVAGTPSSGRFVRCPVCDAAGEEAPGSDGERLSRCATCEVVFRDPRPSIGRLRDIRQARFAGAMVKGHAAEQRSDQLFALEVMKGYHQIVSGKSAPLNAFGKKALEIGSGLGYRLREFEKYGWSILGTEASPDALEYARGMVIETLASDLEAIPKSRGPFHLILVDEVLAGVPDPGKMASALLENLDRQGVVCVAVPETESGEPVLPDWAIYGFSEEALRRLFMPRGAGQPVVARVESRLVMWFGRKKEIL